MKVNRGSEQLDPYPASRKVPKWHMQTVAVGFFKDIDKTFVLGNDVLEFSITRLDVHFEFPGATIIGISPLKFEADC